MSLSVPERIAQIAEHFARHSVHGYSQTHRGSGSAETVTLSDGSKVTITNGDVDCSEMVRQCVNCALSGNYRSPIGFMYTGNEDAQLKAQGFSRMAFTASKVRCGDVLLRSGHTGVALGGGRQAEAFMDERGGIIGSNRGDQTGGEVRIASLSGNWAYIYRYPTDTAETEAFPVTETVTVRADGVNVRDAPSTKTGKVVASYSKGQTFNIDGVVLSDGIAWGTYVGGTSGKRRYVALGTTELAGV